MTTTVVRTVIVYIVLMLSTRLMGKRQMGQLQPAEIVFSVLISNIIAMPIEDPSRPMLTAIISVLLLSSFEVIASALALKSGKFRRLTEGMPVIVVDKGRLCTENLKTLRYTVDDVLEALRKKDVFDISEVQYAVAETDGTLSVLLKTANQTAEKQDVNAGGEDELPCAVVTDGRIIKEPYYKKQFTARHIEELLRQ